MFMKFYELIFIFLLMTSTIIASSSSSWFTSWMGLELNLLMIIPLIINKFNSSSTEATIKYFLVQAMSSTLFLIFSLMNYTFVKMNLINNSDILILSALMIKTGMPPFHFWFPQVVEKMAWKQCFIMLTWQKIAPLILVSFIYNATITLFVISGAVIGAMGGFNQNSMKKILTYSSISHSSWMISIISQNFKIWLNYFLIYTLISFSIITMLFMFHINNIKNMIYKNINFMLKAMFSLNMLSLGGLPPLFGFLGKFMVITKLLEMKFSFFVIMVLVGSSLISLFFYFKTIYFLLTLNSSTMNFNKKIKNNKNNSTPFFLYSILLNIMMPFLVMLT
nr:NADH dehydrogenase subunit 2 [Aphaenomurus interpositus]